MFVILVLSVTLLAVLYSLFVAVGRPCRCLCRPPSLSLTSLVPTAGPLVGPARPPCNYPFPTLIEARAHNMLNRANTISMEGN
jgi:hypothetical protein